MTDAITFLNGMRDMMWNALRSTNMPVLNCSYLTFFLSLFLLSLIFVVYETVCGDHSKGGVDKHDNNNHFIYKR